MSIIVAQEKKKKERGQLSLLWDRNHGLLSQSIAINDKQKYSTFITLLDTQH